MRKPPAKKLDPTLKSEEVRELEQGLRDRIVGQEEAVCALVNAYKIFQSGLNPPDHPVANLMFLGLMGCGKCLSSGTLVLMFDGTLKKVENILIGDLLMGPDSRPREVLSLAHGWDEMYDIIPQNGDAYRVNKSHILSLVMTPAGKRIRNGKLTGQPKSSKDDTIINISVEDYLSKSKTFKRCAKGYRTGVEFSEQPVPIDSYFFGLWLGDGNANSAHITSDDIEIIETVYAVAAAKDMEVTVYNTNSNKAPGWNIHSGHHFSSKEKGIKKNRNVLINSLRTLGVLNNKHIPLIYKSNSRQNRLELLAGLMDSDGSKHWP